MRSRRLSLIKLVPALTLALLAFFLVLSRTKLIAQAPSARGSSSDHPAATIPALFLSDIHFDPFLDPTKATVLNAMSAADWGRILARPEGPALSAGQQSAFAACNSDKNPGTDTSYTLWQSTLAEFKKIAATSHFVVLTGDILAHKFDCKYRALVPGATDASYLAFTEKTIRYVLTTLHTALSGVPIYATLGNNDSGCADYALDAQHDAFLSGLAPLIAETANLTSPDRPHVERDFAALGAYNVPLAALPHTRIITVDDLFLSAKYSTCSGSHDAEPSAAAITWLKSQLASARAAHDRVWFVGHIPPGVDLYATARKLANVCGGAKPTMFLGSEDLAETLAAYPDVVRLALFGHTHDDEMRLLTSESQTPAKRGAELTIPETAEPQPVAITGVPLKVVASITPIHGNRPTFTLARVNPSSATLADYTVMMASNPAQSPITWSREYTYSSIYHEPAFDPASLTALIADFQGDPGDKWPSSQAYIRSYFPADAATAEANSAVISAAWKPYACSLNHDSAKSFAACACSK